MEPSTENANSESHYRLLVLAIFIGLFGVYFRFTELNNSSMISNIVLILGVGVALKAIFAILE